QHKETKELSFTKPDPVRKWSARFWDATWAIPGSPTRPRFSGKAAVEEPVQRHKRTAYRAGTLQKNCGPRMGVCCGVPRNHPIRPAGVCRRAFPIQCAQENQSACLRF